VYQQQVAVELTALQAYLEGAFVPEVFGGDEVRSRALAEPRGTSGARADLAAACTPHAGCSVRADGGTAPPSHALEVTPAGRSAHGEQEETHADTQ
jgi:hypothetical protein